MHLDTVLVGVVPHRWHVENCRHRLAFCLLHYCPLCLAPLKNQDPQEKITAWLLRVATWKKCWTNLENLGSLENPNLTSQCHAEKSTTHGAWYVSNMFKVVSLESRGAATSRFEVPLGIFLYKTLSFQGGWPPPESWRKLGWGFTTISIFRFIAVR